MSASRSDLPENPSGQLPPAFHAVLQAIREIEYGTVEIVLHQGEVREIRQIRKRRIGPGTDGANS